ncbi:MAG: macro domain-containing protein [Chloroflexota bacterium]|nr:macro domain-containing protein [Chloroflexota bacterium]
MSIRYTSDDIFAIGVEAIVNPVNCVGVSGAGLAKQFAQHYPENDRLYRQACAEGHLRPGRGLITESGQQQPRYIINFPTKRHWRGRSRIEDIRLGLRNLHRQLLIRGITSVALPALGAGLGGIDWKDVRALIETELGTQTAIEIIVCVPQKRKGAGNGN